MLINARYVDWWDEGQVCRNAPFHGPESLARELLKGFAGFMDMKALARNPEWKSCRPNQLSATPSAIANVRAAHDPTAGTDSVGVGSATDVDECRAESRVSLAEDAGQPATDLSRASGGVSAVHGDCDEPVLKTAPAYNFRKRPRSTETDSDTENNGLRRAIHRPPSVAQSRSLHSEVTDWASENSSSDSDSDSDCSYGDENNDSDIQDDAQLGDYGSGLRARRLDESNQQGSSLTFSLKCYLAPFTLGLTYCRKHF